MEVITDSVTDHSLLIVDDDIVDLMIIKRWISEGLQSRLDLTIKVRVAHSISEADAILTNERISLLLLDLSLPDATGLSGLKYLSERHPEVPIIIYSGNYDPEIAFEAVKTYGAQDFIIKGTTNKEYLVRSIVHAIWRHEQIRALRKKLAS